MPSISSFFVSFSSSSFSFSSFSSSPSSFFLLPPFCPPSHSSSGVTAILSSSWRSSIRRTKGRDHLLADTRVPSRAYRGKTDRCFPSVSSSPIGATSMSSAAYSSLSLSLSPSPRRRILFQRRRQSSLFLPRYRTDAKSLSLSTAIPFRYRSRPPRKRSITFYARTTAHPSWSLIPLELENWVARAILEMARRYKGKVCKTGDGGKKRKRRTISRSVDDENTIEPSFFATQIQQRIVASNFHVLRDDWPWKRSGRLNRFHWFYPPRPTTPLSIARQCARFIFTNLPPFPRSIEAGKGDVPEEAVPYHPRPTFVYPVVCPTTNAIRLQLLD